MNKKKILKPLFIFLVIVCAVGCIYSSLEKKKAEETAMLEIDYRQQNRSFARVSGRPTWEEEYAGYEAIDQKIMYVRLAAYNEWKREHGAGVKELTLSDIEEYLSSEYNEDGSLRIHSGFEEIREYVVWYHMGGDVTIDKYWSELSRIGKECLAQNPQITCNDPKDMGMEQIQELIKKREDPSYEINIEVMKDQENE